MRIGLLGGSFNPAHDGHRHISLQALERLGLDQVWWLVSPQNPLKPVDGMAPFDERVAAAQRVANDPRIRVSAIEKDLGTRYTADTLAALKTQFPDHRFVWLMGADNLIQMPRWRLWQRIFHTVPIAVFPRAPYSLKASSCKAARRFGRSRIRRTQAKRLAGMPAPAWVLLRILRHPESATRIREARSGMGRRRDTERGSER